jgi:muramoyltetrapeptide carboxypeptidase LdcA involved in peptidoglycan recycling
VVADTIEAANKELEQRINELKKIYKDPQSMQIQCDVGGRRTINKIID